MKHIFYISWVKKAQRYIYGWTRYKITEFHYTVHLLPANRHYFTGALAFYGPSQFCFLENKLSLFSFHFKNWYHVIWNIFLYELGKRQLTLINKLVGFDVEHMMWTFDLTFDPKLWYNLWSGWIRGGSKDLFLQMPLWRLLMATMKIPSCT